MGMMSVGFYLGFAVTIIFLGFYCVLTKKNVIKSAIGISIMVKGGSLSFLSAGGSTAQVAVVLIIVIDAIVAAVLLSLAVNVYRQTGSLDIEALKRLRW
jgi:NADH:ubiquinone oxidoreductase subunit K